MDRKELCQRIADSEAERWSAKSISELISELQETQEYELDVDSKRYQIEVELLENTDAYIHVLVAVDDGSLLYALRPVTAGFISRKS